MANKHCFQLGNIPKTKDDYFKSDRYICRITGCRCGASSYEDADPGHPASVESAQYDDNIAKFCPAYDVPDKITKQIKRFRLEVKKSKLEKEITEIDKAKGMLS